MYVCIVYLRSNIQGFCARHSSNAALKSLQRKTVFTSWILIQAPSLYPAPLAPSSASSPTPCSFSVSQSARGPHGWLSLVSHPLRLFREVYTRGPPGPWQQVQQLCRWVVLTRRQRMPPLPRKHSEGPGCPPLGS